MTNANPGGSAPAGSPPTGPAIDPNNPGAAAGQPGARTGAAASDVVSKAEYDQLFSRFGTQGNELGQYKTFFESITPLLTKLESDPDLVQGIMDSKITGELAKAVVEGRVQIGDAAAVQQAATAVQSNPDNQNKTPAEITALIEQTARDLRKEFEEKSELQNFEQATKQFIESTPDFTDFAPQIAEWLDKHDITDVQIAYYAVKGQLSEAAAKQAAEAASGEVARSVVANAAGGNSPAQFAHNNQALVDQLIAGRPNPNSLI